MNLVQVVATIMAVVVLLAVMLLLSLLPLEEVALAPATAAQAVPSTCRDPTAGLYSAM